MVGNCRRLIADQAGAPRLEGELSFALGFLPGALTPEKLPTSHALWDELAAALPRSFFSSRVRDVWRHAPVLSAEVDALPPSHLTRAAVVLSALAHAYWRSGSDRFFPRRITQVPRDLPDGILTPWRSVVRRLGRYRPDQPFQNFYDLFLANYRLRRGLAANAPRIIENLEVLVPSFQNEAERVFYMAFVEMTFHLTPLVSAACEIEEAIASDDDRGVVQGLTQILSGLERATSVWQKISARAGSRVFCDPVLWSKTAAILGVPPEGTPQGATSGACAPMLHVLDSLLGRSNYTSHYGQFVTTHVLHYLARPVRGFAEHLRAVSLVDYVREHEGTSRGAELRDALEALRNAYSGERGWLGRHTAKVFNYLCISTITGRNASVSGDERYFGRQTWVAASSELDESRRERARTGCPLHGHLPPPTKPATQPAGLGRVRTGVVRDRGLPTYTRFDVARHYQEDDLWLIIDDLVCDVSSYLSKHPGGAPILLAYAGQDVTELFWSQILHDTPAVRALLDRCVVGRVVREDPRHDPALYDVICTLIRCHQASRMQYAHALGGDLGLKLLSDENAHMLLLEENLAAAYEILVPDGWREVMQSPEARYACLNAQRLSSELDFGDLTSIDATERIERRCRLLARADLDLTRRLLSVVFEVARAPAELAAQAGEATLSRGSVHDRVALAMHRELAAYFAGVCRESSRNASQACASPGPPYIGAGASCRRGDLGGK